MDILKINEYLSGNVEGITKVLDAIGFAHIEDKCPLREIRCGVDETSNRTSVKINIDTLSYVCFSTGDNGNIYTAVMTKLGCTFQQSLVNVAEILKDENISFEGEPIKYPFSGFYKELMDRELSMEVYNEPISIDILDAYEEITNVLFLRDGIDFETQKFFSVGYDSITNRITIPQWDMNGELVGVMGRLNEAHCDHGVRWLPIIACSRSGLLYGYHYNYTEIQKKDKCIIFESEKSVMQARSMGINTALATCGNHISATQSKYIKGLMVSEIILAYDEGLDEEQLINSCKKIVTDNPIYKNKVGYIYDEKHEILEKDSKASPSDLGKKKLTQLLKTKVRWLK